MARTALFLTLLLVFFAGIASAAQAPITVASSGKTIRIARSDSAVLRLSGRWGWSEPRVSSRAVELTPVEYFRDPGYSEWLISARSRGTATIRSVGTPACAPCGLTTRSFRTTIVVG